MNASTDQQSVDFQWPAAGLTRVPFRVYSDADIYAREQTRIFKGPVWNYLCLACELSKPGDYLVTKVGEVSVVVTRDEEGELNAFINRCSHRGAMLCLDRCGNSKRITCVYHAWSYDLKGNLAGVAFKRGVNKKGGMPSDFDMKDHGLRRLEVSEFCGLVFGSFDPQVPPIEEYLGPEIADRIKRVLCKPVRILGRNTQVLHNNWKLYFENVKDSYHASILHLFFTKFRINRLSQEGAIIVDSSGGNHVSYTRNADEVGNEEYQDQQIRSATKDYKLADPSFLNGYDEFGDGISLQILSVFPGFVLQQVQNSLAIRQIVPTGVEETDLNWTYIGFEDDDDETTELRLKQGNLVGPAGYISLEDGAIGGFVQRAIRGQEDDCGVVEMGGSSAESQDSRATEASVRGFWKKYRQLMEY